MTVRQCIEIHLHSFDALFAESLNTDINEFYRGAFFAAKLISDDLQLFVPEGVLDAYKRIDD